MPPTTLALCLVALAQDPWPAETWASAQNLTAVEGPGTNDFHVDLSGACWNPLTRRLWLCRNGPTGATSKVWVLREDAAGSFVVDTQGSQRGEWTGFGDLEAVAQADFGEAVIFTLDEGSETIREYGVSTYGVAVLQNTWDTSAFLPLSGGLGAEGLTFVPDAHLAAQGFVDAAGLPHTSTHGTGGLFFVGHQNGGRVYAFDLDRTSGSFTFVGAYRTGGTETAELAFDRSTGRLYALHGHDVNEIEVLSLASTVVGTERKLVPVLTYAPPPGMPSGTNLEGLTLVPKQDCASGERSLFLTVDDGGAVSLVRFREFPCGESAPIAQIVCAGDGSFPVACPCGNTGAAHNGCGNSIAGAGARLDAPGTSTPAVLELLASGVPPTSFVVFAASPGLSASGATFGDGLRCLANPVHRLRARNAVAGVAVLGPSAGDPSVAVLSGATPGTTLWYQAFYRDAHPAFCTPLTYNATNAQRVTW
jgi:hypothetical protein